MKVPIGTQRVKCFICLHCQSGDNLGDDLWEGELWMGANLSRKRKRLVKLATTIYDYRHSKLTSSYRMEGLSVYINYVCMGGGKVSGCVSVCVRVSKQTPCGSISHTKQYLGHV